MSEFDHNGKQGSLMQIFMSYHRELFGLWKLRLTIFFCFVCYLFVALLCLYFLFKLELFWAWPSYTRIPTNRISYSYSYSYAYETPILCSCRLLYWSHADSRIFSIFQHQLLSKKQVSPFRAELRFELPFEVFRESVSPSLVFAQLIAYRDAQFVCI